MITDLDQMLNNRGGVDIGQMHIQLNEAGANQFARNLGIRDQVQIQEKAAWMYVIRNKQMK